MIKNNRSMVRKLMNIVLIGMIIFCFYQGLVQITYANANMNKPDVVITIHSDGRMSCEGNLLGSELWYPGKEASGVIRIYNNFRATVLKDFGLSVTLNKSELGIDRDYVNTSFLNNMKLTLMRGKLLIFNETVYEDRSFMQLVNNTDGSEAAGYPQTMNCKIPGNDSIDFNYILRMDEESGDELENLSASVELRLNLQEDVVQEDVVTEEVVRE